jgi:4-hydroxy-3-polyprenylbenzoate decarboxylase
MLKTNDLQQTPTGGGSRALRVVVGITGASGQIYAKKVLERLSKIENIDLDIVFTDTGMQVFSDETGEEPETLHEKYNANILDNHGYYNRNASGSNAADVMIIIPCTMGTVGRIAHGTTTDLLSRIAEVQLKERKTLIIVPRETPLSLIHLKNLTIITEAGAIVAPACPAFYNSPNTIEELADQFAERIISISGICSIDQKNKFTCRSLS